VVDLLVVHSDDCRETIIEMCATVALEEETYETEQRQSLRRVESQGILIIMSSLHIYIYRERESARVDGFVSKGFESAVAVTASSRLRHSLK
jgi:hypothetical protein